MSIRLGIVGLGNILDSHLRAVRQLSDVAVTAVCDVDVSRREAVAAELSVAGVAHQAELFDAVDAVLVALPHGLHCEVSVAALEAGCHVVVEKPMAVSVTECRRMLAAAERAGRCLLVAESAAAHAGVQHTRRAYAGGRLGRFLTGSSVNARFYFHEGRPTWFLDPRLSGGGMFANVGLHRLAVARTCLPELTPVTVSAAVLPLAGHPVEACTTALVRYDGGGSMAYEEVGYFPRPQWLAAGTHLVFEAGIVSWDDGLWRLQPASGAAVEEELDGPAEPYQPVYAALVAAVQDGPGDRAGEPGFGARQYAGDVAIVEAAYESARAGREVDLREARWRIPAA